MPLQLEAARAQRYYYFLGGATNGWQLRAGGYAGGGIGQTLRHPQVMRTAPTGSIVGSPAYSNASGLGINATAESAVMSVSVTSNGDAYVTANGTGNLITFDADL